MNTINKTDNFLLVIETNKGIIYKVANSYCKDAEDRNDLVQEIILKLWKSFDTYNEQFKHSTWIYRISLNTAISYYRKERIRKEFSNTYPETIFSLADSEDFRQKEQSIMLLNQLISELKELDKALMLLYLDEKSHKEISEILGISESNVATKLGRIKAILKQKYSTINP